LSQRIRAPTYPVERRTPVCDVIGSVQSTVVSN
ncbi:hypothetical protein CP8484711_0676B, partial [Chlamydia psittaci 84-8471/1]